jgi:subtilisin-like proprotein convertase family protein
MGKNSVTLLLVAMLLAPLTTVRAELGLARENFGVWDREGLHAVTTYPYTRGQSCDLSWGAVHTARNTYDWSQIDVSLQFAVSQNQAFTCKISPIDASAPNKSMPSWMFSAGVPSLQESGIGAATYTYGYYLDPEFKVYFEEMVRALASKLRTQITPIQQAKIAFVRVDTGCTGDEEPYENGALVPAQYQISASAWQEYRRWVFELYRQAFQEGPGPIIPLLFVTVEPPDQQAQWDWILEKVKGGFGIKHGGQLRGYHLTESESNVTVFKPLAVDSDFKFFSRNEMDQTWQYPYFSLNRPLSMYWAALEQLNVGMSVWDWGGTSLEGASANGLTFAGEFFNKWAAELDPATAGGGFCVFHDGLDSSDTSRFPEATAYGGNAYKNNTLRYQKICELHAGQGAAMDHLDAATWGQVAQRNPPDQPPGGQLGFNDAGWKIHRGNYDRFITQLLPDTTSKGLWRVRGPLTTTSDPYDRFARRSDHSSGQDTMYFNINDNLLPSLGQRVQLNVTYLDRGTGQFRLNYDAVGSAQKTAFTVTKTNTDTWKTQSIEVVDWCFGNRGTNGSDLQLVNVAADTANPDTIFHGIEVIKLADVSVGIIGQGTVTGRNNVAAYTPLPSSVMEGQRLELQATAVPGWVFTGWSGALTGTTPNPFFFPTKDTRLTATFAQTSGSSSSTDNFSSGLWTGGSGWSGAWTTSGTTTLWAGGFVELNGTTGGGAQITRTLAAPLTNVTLSFDWDLDRLASGEHGDVWVFDDATGAWVNVWNRDSSQNGTDASNSGDANFQNSGAIVLGSSRRVSQIRFSVTSGASNKRFYVDNVSLSGASGNNPPTFIVDPIVKSSAAIGVAYAGTLVGQASDPSGNPLMFTKLSKISGETDWLTVSSSGALAGTPTSADVGINRWMVQVSSSGGSDTAILLIDVSAPGPNPPMGLISPSPSVYTKGTAIANIALASSGGSVMRYVASPRLPKGLYLNSTTGVISGTPIEVAATATYSITATNSDGSTTSNATITVNDIPPTALTYSSNPATYKKGTASTANTPSNTGGTVVSYAVSPALPAGLTLNGVTGVISGTPTVATPMPMTYRITATNTGGSTFCDVSITIEDAYLTSTPITINDGATAPFISSPYPSSILVPTTAGTINKVTAQLVGFSHARQNDMDVLLVGPQGQTVILMSDVGGSSATSNVDLTFDDAASASLPTTAVTISTGTYKPTDNTPADNFPTPAPAGPYGTTLSVFNGTNPTGAWSLYVVDDRVSNTGSLSGGWNLKFEMAASVVPPSSLSYSSNPVTYTNGTAITANTPTSSGGVGVSYAVSPALPAGLTLNTSNGVISGTPSAVTATTSYTITATNSGGSTTASVSIAVVSPYAAWSNQYHLVQGAGGDDDGDCNSNLFEFVAGLIPTDASSVFKVTPALVPNQPNQLAISFRPIVSGRSYTVFSSDSLNSANGLPLGNFTSSDTGNVRTVIDHAATGAKKFYWIEISSP